jgi:hypothetical protein
MFIVPLEVTISALYRCVGSMHIGGAALKVWVLGLLPSAAGHSGATMAFFLWGAKSLTGVGHRYEVVEAPVLVGVSVLVGVPVAVVVAVAAAAVVAVVAAAPVGPVAVTVTLIMWCTTLGVPPLEATPSALILSTTLIPEVTCPNSE